MRAILSVSDKSGLVDFAKGLRGLGIDLYSTGGTKKALLDAGVDVHSISDITGFPEILDGRVKTLHPNVHGGILARRDLSDHVAQLATHGIEPIDLVVVNLYPFVQTILKTGVSLQDALEQIDIGGPTMIRASAKNFPGVTIVVDPADYAGVLEELRGGGVGLETRKRLAQKAFQHTASYDTAIAAYLREPADLFPAEATVAMTKTMDLRYGENPHQKAALYRETFGANGGITSATRHAGDLSYNNILDFDAALNIVKDFSSPTVVIIKHNNPCGLCSSDNLPEAYQKALQGDPVSAFGGIVGLNRPVDLATAEAIKPTHYDGIVAPGYSPAAMTILKGKRGLRILEVDMSSGGYNPLALDMDIKRVNGGFLFQTRDALTEGQVTLKTVTEREPTAAEIRELLFGWRIVKHVKSNAIVIIGGHSLLGMGAGQPNRVTSVKIALERAGAAAQGSVLASDAFFPFSDGVELAAKGGVRAIIQPGGSLRDQETIEMANKYGVAMVFTGQRHFKH
ncbi:MAG: bifunctional phosphoribosylaminoimidazolecarboxamide formyltransferase/IMP cyclohydrolase [Dehalococcoidia bacterium]|nr:bifunctional phosphoribosylaminoimidazolecarboxamide formyltransferase/IMP cyclohydrolase [Dehalococcoidia bacterium]